MGGKKEIKGQEGKKEKKEDTSVKERCVKGGTLETETAPYLILNY